MAKIKVNYSFASWIELTKFQPMLVEDI